MRRGLDGRALSQCQVLRQLTCAPTVGGRLQVGSRHPLATSRIEPQHACLPSLTIYTHHVLSPSTAANVEAARRGGAGGGKGGYVTGAKMDGIAARRRA